MMHWIMRLGLSFHLLLPSAPGDGDKQPGPAWDSPPLAAMQRNLIALQRRVMSLGSCSKHGKGVESADDERKNSLLGTLSWGRLLCHWSSRSNQRSPRARNLVLGRGSGTEGLPAWTHKELSETTRGETWRHWPVSPHATSHRAEGESEPSLCPPRAVLPFREAWAVG